MRSHERLETIIIIISFSEQDKYCGVFFAFIKVSRRRHDEKHPDVAMTNDVVMTRMRMLQHGNVFPTNIEFFLLV